MTLLTWGANSHGQLGLGLVSEQETSPVPVMEEVGGVRDIVGGGGHTLLCDNNGHVYVTGWNNAGQLGLGQTDPVCVFTSIKFSHVIRSVAAGWDFSLLLTEGGEVFACGSNSFGQLGVGDSNIRTSSNFIKIQHLKNIRKISAGLRHAGCVDGEGNVFVWGAGTKGQLGNGKITKQLEPTKISSISQATDVHCGQYFTLVETEYGVMGVGDNKYFQLGAGINASNVMVPVIIKDLQPGDQIHCGWTHIVRSRDGAVSVTGRDDYHQCAGGGTVMAGVRKALAGSEHCLSLTEEGSVWSWGWNEHNNCGLGDTPAVNVPRPVRLQLEDVKNIFVGSAHNFALT